MGIRNEVRKSLILSHFSRPKVQNDTILILKYVEPIETEYFFGYKPRFLGGILLAFLGII